MSQDAPIFREVDSRVVAEWPEVPRRSYEVSHELLELWVVQENRRRDFEAALSAIRRITDDTIGLNGHGKLHSALATIQEISRAVLLARVEG